jgi:hypothetical protein
MPVTYTLDRDGWRLLSGEEHSARHPATFHIPSRKDRESLTPGDGVQLMFDIETRENGLLVDRGVDRMWLIVKRRTGEAYVGVLDNDPGREELPLDPGLPLRFGPEHVIAIQRPPDGYVLEKYGPTFFDEPDYLDDE